MNVNQRVAQLEKRMTTVEAEMKKEDLRGINTKLDSIITVSNAAKHTGNFIVDNLPRIIGGVVAGLSTAGVIAATQSQNVSTLFGG